MSLIDYLVQFGKVLSSNINPRTYAVQVDIAGIGPLEPDNVSDLDGERGEQSEMFGALGFVSRPLDPEVKDGNRYECEAVCLRTEDGLIPIAWRDLRLNTFFPAGVPKGRIGMVGYKGALHTIDVTGDNNTQTIYVPYDFDGGGNPQKAMVVTLDTSSPGNEHITMSIGGGTEGYQMSMNLADGLQVRTPDNSTFFNIRESEITLTAEKIMLKGNVYLGAAAEASIPLNPTSASTTVSVSA
jgi:hypothetical protein